MDKYSLSEMKEHGFGDYKVVWVSEFLIKLPDGTELAASMWCPFIPDISSFSTVLYEGSCHIQTNVPCILEYLPYRRDWSAARDYPRHPWLCSHGYVCLRVDMRGSGNSTGRKADEYTMEEIKDCIDVLEWVDKQPWSSGNVGMYGKSWGGFNSLQTAFYQPKQLKAIVSLFSSDRRYTDDTHYRGGLVVGNGMLYWHAQMFMWMARPPTPKESAVDDEFQARWKERLDNLPGWGHNWLKHTTEDQYWGHGSISVDYNKLNAPVLLVAGWNDPYFASQLRMGGKLPNARTIVGPWTHNWPDTCTPGPNIDYLMQCLQWFDQHLKGIAPENAEDDYVLKMFVRKSHRPRQDPVPGQWVGFRDWDGEFTSEADSKHVRLYLSKNKLVTSPAKQDHQTVLIDAAQHSLAPTSLTYCPFSVDMSVGDQQSADSVSCCWDSDPLEEDVTIVGSTAVHILVKALGTSGIISARLCDVFEDGVSVLIADGVINLAHLSGHQSSVIHSLEPGSEHKVFINLTPTGYQVQAGHVLRLAINQGLFPSVWPLPYSHGIEIKESVDYDVCSFIDIPTVNINMCPKISFGQPLLGPAIQRKILEQNQIPKYEQKELDNNEVIFTEICDDGLVQYPTLGVTYGERVVRQERIIGHNPTTATAQVDGRIRLNWKCIDTEIKTHNKMSCSKDQFTLVEEVVAYLNGSEFYSNSWSYNFPRGYL